jgi:hypothetical protein
MDEAAKRDKVLDALAATRRELVCMARVFATVIVNKAGRVTSPEVMREMRDRGWGPKMDLVDPRFMGVVFRRVKGAPQVWERLGWENGGSHCRPVAIWGLA